MSVLIKNTLEALIYKEKSQSLKNIDIYIEDNRIKEIGVNLNKTADTIINAENMVAVPGMVNTHHHLYQTLFRNIPKVQNAKFKMGLRGDCEIADLSFWICNCQVRGGE